MHVLSKLMDEQILLLHPYHSAAPISLLSLTTYLALQRTRLPKPISEVDELAHFNDDWDQSIPLYPQGQFPPLCIPISIHGESTILVDPSMEECAVAEGIMAVTVNGDKVVSVKTIESSGKAVGDKGEEWVGGRGGAHSSKWVSGLRMAISCGKEVQQSLEGLLKSEE
jgi:exosome complex RNA-binding protein Rrp42 (RNase PH superfamily)